MSCVQPIQPSTCTTGGRYSARSAGRQEPREDDRVKARRASVRGRHRQTPTNGRVAGLDSGKETLQTFAEQTWHPQYWHHLERSTRESYAATWDRHIKDALGGYPLREITAPVLSAYFADLRAQGVGPAAIKRAKAILPSCLSRAVERGLIHGNSATSVKLPRAQRKPSVSAIGPRDVERLRVYLGIRDATLVSVLAYVGLRPGEALALTWGDIASGWSTSSARTTTGRSRARRPGTAAPLG